MYCTVYLIHFFLYRLYVGLPSACYICLPGCCQSYFSPFAWFFYISTFCLLHGTYFLLTACLLLHDGIQFICMLPHTYCTCLFSVLPACLIWSSLLRIHIPVAPCLLASTSIFIIGLPKSHLPPIPRVLTHRHLPLSTAKAARNH